MLHAGLQIDLDRNILDGECSLSLLKMKVCIITTINVKYEFQENIKRLSVFLLKIRADYILSVVFLAIFEVNIKWI